MTDMQQMNDIEAETNALKTEIAACDKNTSVETVDSIASDIGIAFPRGLERNKYIALLGTMSGRDKSALRTIALNAAKEAAKGSTTKEQTYRVAKYLPATIAALQEMNERFARVKVGKTSLILEKNRPGFSPIAYTAHDFMETFGYQQVTADGKDDASLSEVWCKKWSDRKTYKRKVFEPTGSIRTVFADDYNTWNGFPELPQIEGANWDCLRDFIMSDICEKNATEEHSADYLFAWLMTYFAHIWQRPGELPGTALGFWSDEGGTGKNVVLICIKEALGGSLSRDAATRKQLHGDFNADSAGKLIVVADETVTGDSKDGDHYKSLVTADQKSIEEKGIDRVQMSNYERITMTSNNANAFHVVVQKDRRTAVFEVGTKDGTIRDPAFFTGILNHMRNIGGYGAMVAEFRAWIPEDHGLTWLSLRRPPMTKAKVQQAQAHLDTDDYFFLDLVRDGKAGGTARVMVGEHWGEEERSITLATPHDSKSIFPVAEVDAVYEAYHAERPGQVFTKRVGRRNRFTILARRFLKAKRNSAVPHETPNGPKVWSWIFPSLDELRAYHLEQGWCEPED
jgi:hypothetical protein